MKSILFSFLFLSQLTFGQSDKKIIKDLKKSIYFLADDKLEGRRTGMPGEKLAYEFIVEKFKKNKIDIVPGLNSYIQDFEVNDGLSINKNTYLNAGKKTFLINDDFFPLPYSKPGSEIISNAGVQSVFYDINTLISDNSNNPHFDFEEELYQKIKSISETQSLKSIFVFNSSDTAAEYKFDSKNKKNAVSVSVIYCNKNIIKELRDSTTAVSPITFNLEINSNIRTGHNVIAMINNYAPVTVILGAHYDHLGYGEDHNSLFVGSKPEIHNGADDNASGTAALLALSEILKNDGDKKFNYLFVAFSGEELGLFGSKYFTEHCPVDYKNINYMINMDMVGRLNDSTHGLTIGGYGTSPAWGHLINLTDDYFKINVDSSGSGPSDHTSFYRKDLPVLFFFTGSHHDYHKPSDDADKINFKGELKIIRYIQYLIEKTALIEKIIFTKTRESAAMGKSSFKVTMGIMPDYTFSGNGVRVDGVSDNRPAQKAGVKTNDIIYQLGDFMVSDVQAYMQALNKFKKGDTTTVKIKRGTEDIKVEVTF